MRNKERARQYNLLYKQTHKVGIRIRNRLYKRLPHVKKKAQERGRRYFPEYYKKHCEEISKRATEWNRLNRDKRRLINKRYKDKLKQRWLEHGHKIARIVDDFLIYCKDRYAMDTVRQYAASMNRFLKFIDRPGVRCPKYHMKRYNEFKKYPGERDFSWKKDYLKIRLASHIDKDLITKYVSYVNHDEINNKGIKLSQSEKETRLYPLKTFLLYCQRKGYVKKDLRPYIFVPPRENKVHKRLLSFEEMERLLAAPSDKTTIGIRDRAMLELAYSGLRANELLSLKKEHIDIATNAVTILDGKGRKDRVIPMTNEATYWVKRWLNRRSEFIGKHEDTGCFFITKSTKSIIRKNFSVLVKKYARRANIDLDISPHDLRRITATHLAENGAPIRIIQALLGHSTLKVTTKYLRLSDEKIKKEHKETHPSNRRKLHYAKLPR